MTRLDIHTTTCGADHPNMATRHSNLGTMPADLGDLAGARTHYERALEIGQATLRPNHPMVTFRDNLDHALPAAWW
jgi:hypothetical protein